MSDPAVLRHVVETITRGSQAHAEGARQRVAGAGAPVLERLAMALAGAQHTPAPRAERRVIVVVAGDHGVGDPGIALGDAHPTVVAACAIADGTAALAQVSRASRAPVVLIDAGVAERAHMPAIAIGVAGRPSANIVDGDGSGGREAMTIVDAALGLEAGIALAISLTEPGLDVIALGAIGVGAEVASAALLGAATGVASEELGDAVAEAAWARGVAMHGASGMQLLAAFGGPDTAVMAGMMLAAASINIPVVLDGHATGAAALVAAAFAPAVTDHLIAAHGGTFTMPRILAHLGLTPVFDVGLGHGEGTGAAMVIPLLDQVAALTARS